MGSPPTLQKVVGLLVLPLAMFVAPLSAAQAAQSPRQSASGGEPQAEAPAATGKSATLQLPAITVSVEGASYAPLSLDYLATDSSSGAFGDKPILDTPFSITVVNSKDIVERGARSAGQIFRRDASVTSPAPAFSTNWWATNVRGLLTRNYYIDGVPMALTWGGKFPTEAVESVTVLKGLTGFMYGFGDPGGAISYQLKRPAEQPATKLHLGYFNPSLFSAHVDTSQNISEGLAVRFGVAADKGEAYNTTEVDRQVAYLAVDKQFGDSLTWFSNVVYEHKNLTGEPIQFYLSPGTGAGGYDVAGSHGELPEVTYDYDDYSVDDSYYKTETTLVTTGLDWQINNQWQLRYQLGFSHKSHESNKTFADLKNSRGDYRGYLYNFAGDQRNVVTQLMLQGSVATGDVEHELVFGLGWRLDKIAYSSFYYSNDFNGNIYVDQPFRINRVADFSTNETDYENERRYVFASDTVTFNDHWQAIVGVRFTHYENKDTDNNPAVDSAFVNRAVSPTLALIYKPNINTSIYGSYVEGLEPGTIVGPRYANAGDVLDATVSKQYELGVKHVSGKAAWSAALFRIERANVMEQGSAPPELTQNGQVTYDGIELTGAYQFTDNLNLGFSAMGLDASIDETDNPALKGNTPGAVPQWRFVAFGEYRVPTVPGLKLRGGVRYVGEAYAGNTETLEVPAYITVNVGFSYSFDAWNQQLELSGHINNLLNEKYWAASGTSGETLQYGAERNVSLGLSMTF